MKIYSIFYTPEENDFLKNNFFSMTNGQLCDAINSMRNSPIKQSSLLNQCRRLGLQRGIQIRWSKEDIEFLKANYKTHGYTELAMMLNERKSTFRIIDGQKVYRIFNKKHVEKKQELLGLKHTDEETYKIRVRNNQIFNLGYTYENNDWSLGYRTAFPENQIRVWTHHGKSYKYIKIDGKFVFYSRYQWEQKHGPIPSDKILNCKTNDQLNCDPENWELISRGEAVALNTGRKELTDEYILAKLSHRAPELKQALAEIPQLIELKRSQIKLKRTINELNQVTTND